MKKIDVKYIAVFLLGLYTLLSCKKSFLETTPKGQFQQANYYSTPAEAFAGLAAAYDPLVSETGGLDGSLSDPRGLLNSGSDDCYAGGGGSGDTPNWQPELRAVGGRMAAEIVGNLIGEQFYTSLHQLHPIEDLKHTRGPVLFIYGTKDEVVPVAEIEQAHERLAATGIPTEVISIEGADHVFFNHAWQRQVVDQTTLWLRRVLLPDA